jgi:hypothetical protein
LKHLSQGEYRQTIDQIGYYFNDPVLRNLEAGSPTDLGRETVAELNDLSSGVPVAGVTFIGKTTKASPPPGRCGRRMIVSSHLRIKNDTHLSFSVHP